MASCSGYNGLKSDDGEMSFYRKDALSVVTFKIVYNQEAYKKKHFLEFKPTMAHQIFGESESVFGYRSLSIALYFLHNSCNCYVDVKSSGRISSLYKADNIMENMNSWLPENFTTDERKFLELLDKEKHDLVFGSILAEFKDTKTNQLFREKQVHATYKITLCDVNDESFKDFHRRFETFIVWYIDGANFIDLEDERWLIFYVYEEIIDPETKRSYITPVGFCSVYKFFAYPSNIRPRISQFFILPSHQRRGIGKMLYGTVMNKLRDMPEVVDVTVEEPTTTFQRMRDLDDCLSIHHALKDTKVYTITSSPKKIYEVMRKYKICKKQCQRIYDILLGSETSKKNEEYRNYLNSIKKRISADAERESRGSKRLCNVEGLTLKMEHTDKNGLIEAEYKKYVDDIEQSIISFKKYKK
ncbi:unnamed protein product [Phaedon cochleariae]|uniref:histone acetyltransferase n=1 Tax=Phaedon cochleariae TaxID=80249 RepID=A0A9P0GQ52_PHACE|nr:unnamed protein product [Phaedon cochleariae]